jgi:8-oxo-dGTP diphosphatase
MPKVTAAIIEKEGKILIARRKKGDSMADKWEFPGGEIEPNETPEQCLKRELFEEFGIEVKVGEFIGSSRVFESRQPIELIAYKVSHISGEFKPSAHEETRWVLPSEFNGYDFAEADRMIIKKLLSRA